MEYQTAKDIRGRSISSLIRANLTAGSGVTSSVKRALSQKIRARGTAIKEKFDPLNIVRFMTGGSRLATAAVGRLTGRKRSDIEYFTGTRKPKRTYTNISKTTPGQLDASSVGILSEILTFMKQTHEEDTRREQTEKAFREEKENEEQRRHERFVAVLQNYVNVSSGLGPIEKPKEDEKEGIFSKMLSTLKDALSGILGAMKTIVSTIFKGVVALLSKLMGSITSLLSTLFTGMSKIVSGIIGKLLKGLSWLKIFKSIGNIGKFLLRLLPLGGTLLTFLGRFGMFFLRFAGWPALIAAIAGGGLALLKAAAEKMPDTTALAPEGALNLLKRGSLRDIMAEAKIQDPFEAYMKLLRIVYERKAEAQAALDAFNANPEDPKAIRRVRELGGLDFVKKMAEAPEIDPTEIPGYSEVIAREREQVVPRSLFKQAGIKPDKLGERWDELYGGLYDPISGRRKDLLDFEGPVRPVLPGAISRGLYESSLQDYPGGETGPLMDPNIPTPMTPQPVPPIDRSELLNYTDSALMMTLPQQGDTNIVNRSANPVTLPDTPRPVAADVRNNSDQTFTSTIKIYLPGEYK